MSFRHQSRSYPLCFSLLANGLLLLAIAYLLQRDRPLPPAEIALANFARLPTLPVAQAAPRVAVGSERRKLNYQQWVDLLARQALIAASEQPVNLSILLGDSITLWFTDEQLPSGRTWLNQGISGENSHGLLRRLRLIDATQPETIYLMIGINDVLNGVSDETLLANYTLIVRSLKRSHPDAKIIVQSILPHSGAKATWEGRDRLLINPNLRIRNLNLQIEAIARRERVFFLDLYSLFADADGALRLELSTDGLHLNPEGYRVWATALTVFEEILRETQQSAR
ncbi:MAG: lysophospholipase [Spirulinaceae cyanobacterium RM2_2_10]|nr:lysophospholipase [Spirulinaceae cyanobacterium RM2_2_10]